MGSHGILKLVIHDIPLSKAAGEDESEVRYRARATAETGES